MLGKIILKLIFPCNFKGLFATTLSPYDTLSSHHALGQRGSGKAPLTPKDRPHPALSDASSREMEKLGGAHALGCKAWSCSNDIEKWLWNKMLNGKQSMELCLHYSYNYIKCIYLVREHRTWKTQKWPFIAMVSHGQSFTFISIFINILQCYLCNTENKWTVWSHEATYYITPVVSWTCSSVSSNLHLYWPTVNVTNSPPHQSYNFNYWNNWLQTPSYSCCFFLP